MAENLPQDDVRVVAITGGATGIGLATALRLLAGGWRVGVFSERKDSVSDAYNRLRERGEPSRFHAAVVDIRDAWAVRSFFADVAERLGSVSALVSNAAYVPPKGPHGRIMFADVTAAEWDQVLATNLTGAMISCQCVLPAMVKARHGRIVIIGSVAGRARSTVAGVSYMASKAALVGVARSIVGEYSQHGITANTICPGRVVTGLTGPADTPANIAAVGLIPAGRLGQPDEIARVAEFLIQQDAGFINGAIIDVNGGEFAPS